MPSPTKAPTGTPLTTQDPSLLVAALSRDQVSLKLDTFDLCCLAGLYLRAGRDGLASFEEALLLDVFGQICDVVEPGAENRRKRATHAIQRLRDQRMLSRIDGVGLVSPGEYTLSRLAEQSDTHSNGSVQRPCGGWLKAVHAGSPLGLPLGTQVQSLCGFSVLVSTQSQPRWLPGATLLAPVSSQNQWVPPLPSKPASSTQLQWVPPLPSNETSPPAVPSATTSRSHHQCSSSTLERAASSSQRSPT